MKMEQALNWFMKHPATLWALKKTVGGMPSGSRGSMTRPYKDGYDFDHFKKFILGETTEGPVPIIELGADCEIMMEVTGWHDFPLDRGRKILAFLTDMRNAADAKAGFNLMDLSIEYSKVVGYDYVTAYTIYELPRTRYQLAESTVNGSNWRAWQPSKEGLISNREDFKHYPWPATDQILDFPIAYCADKMPRGMKVMVFQWGIFEDLKLLLGFENMAIKSIEEPDLLIDVLENLTVLAEASVDMVAARSDVGAIFMAEDMGFNTGTMLNPKFMREHVIPRQKRIVDACHKHGKPFILHSCGEISAIMEDLIETAKIDAKHSFQDNAYPIDDWYKKYHDRIGILGGVDMDLLARGTPEEVGKRTREIIEHCAPGGGFALGCGNTVANYVKIENYYAMLDEARKWNKAHGWV